MISIGTPPKSAMQKKRVEVLVYYQKLDIMYRSIYQKQSTTQYLSRFLYMHVKFGDKNKTVHFLKIL